MKYINLRIEVDGLNVELACKLLAELYGSGSDPISVPLANPEIDGEGELESPDSLQYSRFAREPAKGFRITYHGDNGKTHGTLLGMLRQRHRMIISELGV